MNSLAGRFWLAIVVCEMPLMYQLNVYAAGSPSASAHPPGMAVRSSSVKGACGVSEQVVMEGGVLATVTGFEVTEVPALPPFIGVHVTWY